MAGRVLVIGRGLAGSMAALAAKKAGADVQVIAQALGRTALSSGMINLAGTVSEGRGFEPLSLRQAVLSLYTQNQHHPYRGFENPYEAIQQGVKALLEVAPGLYPSSFDAKAFPAAYPGELGSAMWSYLAPNAVAKLEDKMSVGVVAISGYSRYRADFLASAWAEQEEEFGKGIKYSILDVTFDQGGQIFYQSGQMARYLDHDEHLELLAERVKGEMGSSTYDLLIFPPALGLEKLDRVERLSSLLGVPCRESVATHASVPGARLSNLLGQALKAAEIPIEQGTVSECRMGSDGIEAVTMKGENDEEMVYEADAFVLASGKFLGGGIRSEGKTFVEPIFNLPVFLGNHQVDELYIGRLTEADFSAAQRFVKLGVRVNDQGLALGEENLQRWDNLFAAGHVLGGFDPFLDGSAEGVDLITGIRAGQKAAEFAV